MNKIVSAVLLLSVVFVFSGCATIFKGDSSKLELTSNPPGASVSASGSFGHGAGSPMSPYMSGGEICSSTPCSVKLKSGQSWSLLFKKDGFKDRTVLVNNKIGAGWIVLDVLSLGWGVLIDLMTGAWYEFDVDNVSVTLEKI